MLLARCYADTVVAEDLAGDISHLHQAQLLARA